MNKKLFLGMFAAAGMLFATSCSNDELDMVQSGNEAQVTFSLGLEGGIATRATISDGTGADVLYYAIYDANKELITTISPETNGLFTKPQAFPNGSKQDEVSVTLAKGQEYTAVFWAQNSACTAYEVTAETKGLKVDVDYEGDNNDETRDAFFKAETFKVTGNAKIDVVLKRPFAQINVGVTEADWNAAVASGITISESKVVIKNAATSINLLTGEVGDETTAVTYDFASIPLNSNEVLKVDVDRDGTIDDDENYKYLSMSYILTDNDADKTTLEADGLQFTFKSGGEDIVFDEGLHAVPVQRNWRTNIIGKLLTGDIQFNIVIDERFYDDYNYPKFEDVADGVKYDAATKTYYLYSAAGLQWLSTETNTNNNQFSGYTVKLTSDVDLNGVTWTPIGKTNAFLGTFDGGNNTISNLTITGTEKSVGLFANARTVKNVKMSNVNITGSDYVGAIVGYGICAKIENCHVDGGTITANVLNNDGGAKVGGIVGYLTSQPDAWVKDCSVKNVTIKGYRDVGGIAGMAQLSSGQCYVNNVSVDNVTVIADMLQDGGKTVADAYAGAVVGRNAGATVSNETTNNVEVIILAFDGNGVLELPSSAAALNCVAAAVTAGNNMEGKTILLTENISYDENVATVPIGSWDAGFKGTFDGQGHTISNMNIQTDMSKSVMGYFALFGCVDNGTVKNITLDNFENVNYGGYVSAVAATTNGDCLFENITLESGIISAYNRGTAPIVSWAGNGTNTYKNINIGKDVTVDGLWASWDCGLGGIVGDLRSGEGAIFENVTVACKLDAFNDVTSSYKWYAYRYSGMLIGMVSETQKVGDTTYPNPKACGVVCTNVTVNYGDWMNYHYCEGYGQRNWARVESGYSYGGLDEGHTHADGQQHNVCLPFNQLFGGGQGVYGLAEYDGVTVNYPESYNAGE